MEEYNTTQYTGGHETDGVTRKKQKKGSFVKGLLCGIAMTLVVTVLATTMAISWLSARGVVMTSFHLDEELTADILAEPIQEKVAEVISALSHYFYDELNNGLMAEGIYRGLVESLGDDYTTYYTIEEYRDYLESASGVYYGIGAVLSQDVNTGIITIIRVYKGSPAEEAGLKAGDIFVSAAGVEAAGMEVSEFVSYVKGEEGTTVDIVVNRNGEELSFVAERRQVEVPTVESQMLTEKVGYLQILEFDEITTVQFETALKNLQEGGMESLVIDLRDNPGGRLDVVSDILDTILPAGMIVYTEDKYGYRSEYKSDADALEMPIVVLTNENSASASEIFAGAIKDYEWGTLLGTTTFGKGIVQVLVPLSDGSAIKITTAKYFTPKGNYIHGVGITPDVVLEYEYLGTPDEDYDIMKDNQVLKALELLE